MTRDPEGRKFRYIVLATVRTGTMQRELNEVPPEFRFVGMTTFLSEVGGGGAVILEAEGTGRQKAAR